MIRLNTNIELENGAIIKHCIVAIISLSKTGVELFIDCFVDDKIADKALEKVVLKKRQEELIEEFSALAEDTNPDEEKKARLDELQDAINEISISINDTTDYSRYVVEGINVMLPYTDKNITENYVITELSKLDRFKDISIYTKSIGDE